MKTIQSSRPWPPFLRPLIGVLIAGCLSCGGNEKASVVHPEIGSPMVLPDSPQVTTLGKIEGPYLLMEVLSPKLLRLGNRDHEEQFELIGLRDGDYPLPEGVDPPSGGTEALKERLRKLRLYKMERMQESLDKKPIWLIRMSEGQPPLVYLFKSVRHSSMKRSKPPPGPAYLINAWLLREGTANMELEGVIHPFYETMMDAQLAAIVEARKATRKGPEAEDIWNRFELQLPDRRYELRIAAIAELF